MEKIESAIKIIREEKTNGIIMLEQRPSGKLMVKKVHHIFVI